MNKETVNNVLHKNLDTETSSRFFNELAEKYLTLDNLVMVVWGFCLAAPYIIIKRLAWMKHYGPSWDSIVLCVAGVIETIWGYGQLVFGWSPPDWFNVAGWVAFFGSIVTVIVNWAIEQFMSDGNYVETGSSSDDSYEEESEEEAETEEGSEESDREH